MDLSDKSKYEFIPSSSERIYIKSSGTGGVLSSVGELGVSSNLRSSDGKEEGERASRFLIVELSIDEYSRATSEFSDDG